MTRIRFFLFVAAVLAVTACTKYQVSGILEGGAEQLAVVHLGSGGFERVDTLDCLAGAFAFDVDYDEPVSIILTDLARQGLQTGKCVRLMTVPGEHAVVSGSLENYTITGSQFYQDQAAYERRTESLGNDRNRRAEAALSFVREHPASLFSATLIGDCGSQAGTALELLDAKVKDGVMQPLIARQLKVLEANQNRETASARIYPGAEAPDFALPTPEGGSLSLSSLQDGKYLLLDFWGSWCHNCIEGLPRMQQLYARHRDRLEILGIDCDESESQWRSALVRYDMPWKHVINDGAVDVSALYGVGGYPTKVLIDPEGRIRKLFVGEGQQLYNYLDGLFR